MRAQPHAPDACVAGLPQRGRERATISRRQFGHAAGALVAAAATCAGCNDSEAGARLTARPQATETSASPGRQRLGIGVRRDAILQVPSQRSGPMPLFVLLHGAGGSGETILDRLESIAGNPQAAVVAPGSSGRTWDALTTGPQTVIDALTLRRRRSGFGADVRMLDAVLHRVFSIVAVDSSGVTIAGFSDGASYALSLGLMNGDLFRRVVAFSPGLVIPGHTTGTPEIFISHGVQDGILPIDRCSRQIVPSLRQAGYAVTYREFDGGHDVPAAIAREASVWALRP
jgi:phospholipase/carboxylesterase